MPLTEEAHNKVVGAAPCRANISAFIGDLVIFKAVRDSFFAFPTLPQDVWLEIKEQYNLKAPQQKILEFLLKDGTDLKPKFDNLGEELDKAMEKLPKKVGEEPCWPCR